MRRTTFAAAIAAIALCACSAGEDATGGTGNADAANTANTPPETGAAPEAAAPAARVERPVRFELTDLDGELRSSDEWQGQPKLINFWATWCAPCRREIPLLKASQDKYSDIDLQVVGIAVDFAEDVAAYAEEAKFNYPVLVGQEDAMAVAESSGVEYIGLPFTMVVAPSGELLTTHVGEIAEAHIVTIAEVFADLESGALDIGGAREKLLDL